MHLIDLPGWAVQRGRPLLRIDALDIARTALLGIDLQNAFIVPGQVFANPHALDIVARVNQLAAAFRHAGGQVMWTRQTVDDAPGRADPRWLALAGDPWVERAKSALRAGSQGHALHAGIQQGAADTVIDKYRYSALLPNASDLDARLRSRGIDTLIITGTLTNCCCESTARDAYMLGYRVLFVADATAAVTDAEHNAALLNLCLMFADVRLGDEVLELIAHAQVAGP